MSTIPEASSHQALKRMKSQKRKDTRPELLLRKKLHRLGLRFVTHRYPLVGINITADILFTRLKVAVFVDGCFWHECPLHGSIPRANGQWWKEKLLANKLRDSRNNETLHSKGWHVVRIWEHEVPEVAASDIALLVDNLRAISIVTVDEIGRQLRG